MSLNRISNQIVQIAKIVPITGAATYNSEYINMASASAGQNEILAKVHCGVVGTSVDAKLVQATDASGTGKKDITGKAITQITTTDENASIELRLDDNLLDSDNDFVFVGLEITTVGATTAVSGEIYGGVCAKEQDSLGPQSYDQADEVVRSTI